MIVVYDVSYKKRKRVFWLFERGIGYRRYCKERMIKRRASRGTSNTRLFRVGELGPYNPVGRNKLPKKSKREQKNTRATYYYQSDSVKKRVIYSKKRNSYVKCNEGKRQKNCALRESHRMG